MRCQIIAECCTNWAGDLELAKTMIAAAADAGADICKFQSYETRFLSPADPQYDWLKQCELSDAAHGVLMAECQKRGVRFLTTIFNGAGIARLTRLGIYEYKVGHAESDESWWRMGLLADGPVARARFVSWPWGRKPNNLTVAAVCLSVVPLYPTPLEALHMLTLLDGYSDHSIGLTACQWAMANGAQVIEKHFSLPGQGRNQAWDMGPSMLRSLRDWAEQMAVIQSGTAHEGRWSHTPTA